MPFQINVKLFERALGWACHSILYNTKGQFDIEKGHLKKGKLIKKNISYKAIFEMAYLKGHI